MDEIKKSINEQIYQILKRDILIQKIEAGVKLINKDIQEKYKVSSTPVRDAINRLWQDGLIEEISKGGARVISFNLKRAMEINEMMSILNRSAVQLSGLRGDHSEISDRLADIIKHQYAHMDSDEYFYWDYQFHKTFFDFMENSECKQVFKKYNVLHELLSRYYHRKEDYRKKAINQHQALCDCFREHRISDAINMMELHYQEVSERFMQCLE